MANNNGYITVSKYPDSEATDGVGYQVLYRTPELYAAWQEYMDSMREYLQNSMWNNPFMQRVGQGLQAVHDFARDEIPMFSRTRQRILALHPDAVDAARLGGDIAAGITLAAAATPYLGAAAPYIEMAAPYLGKLPKFLTSPAGLLTETATTLGLTKNMWLPWLLETGKAAGEAAAVTGGLTAGGLLVDDWIRQHRNQSPDPDAEVEAGRIMSGLESPTPASPSPEDPNKFKWDWRRLKPFSHYGRGQFWGNVASGLRDAAYLTAADYAASALINGGSYAVSGGRVELPVVPYPLTAGFFPPAPVDSMNHLWVTIQGPDGKAMVVDANDSTTRAVFGILTPLIPTLQTTTNTEALNDSDFLVPAAPAVTPAQGSGNSGSGQGTLNYGDPGEVERIAIPTTENTDGRGLGGW